ncbi:hypothetical protein ACFVYJ_04145 [Pontibacter sp. JAM-7]|uniref:ORC-CDC6 family AAA ATPase n=1 Tax=Pontibacter sp. JAM-7 TaxID=3366581 RepID=UPI003AF9F51D
MSEYIPSMHEAFNARTFSTKDLCGSFIVSDFFERLSAYNHSVMVGPRGSGKTTLMRMLSIDALDLWQGTTADFYKENISYSGVFIPTDRLWKSQFERIKTKFQSDHRLLDILDSLFIYHILERFAAAISYRSSRNHESSDRFNHISLSKSDEVVLVKEIAEMWKVKPNFPTISNLEVAISKKKQVISAFINDAFRRQIVDGYPDVISGELQGILDSSVSIVNKLLNDRGHKWCFLFDELELAPDHLVQSLIDAMRGGHEDYILKLALSPYHQNVDLTSGPEGSMSNQDFKFISLTETDDDKGIEFSKQLCGNIFIKKGITKPVDECFEMPPEFSLNDTFASLASKDQSFSEYLSSQEIEIDKISSYTEKDKRPTLRKFQFVALNRDLYLKENGSVKPRRRAPDIYAGFHNICRSLEYNPRMLIGIMNEFVSSIKKDDLIPLHIQIAALEKFLRSYEALLGTIAIEPHCFDFGDKLNVRTVLDLINALGSTFKSNIVEGGFNPEPRGSIIVPHQYRKAVGPALNAGALIVADYEHAAEDMSSQSPFRCRLSYIFAHRYWLLMTLQREETMDNILEQFVSKNSKTKIDQSSQMELL